MIELKDYKIIKYMDSNEYYPRYFYWNKIYSNAFLSMRVATGLIYVVLKTLGIIKDETD